MKAIGIICVAIICGMGLIFGGLGFLVFTAGDDTAAMPSVDFPIQTGGGNLKCRPEDYKVQPSQVVQWAIEAGWPSASSADRSDLAMITSIAGPESCYDPSRMGDNYPINGLLCQSWGLVQVRSCPDNPDPRHLDRGRPEFLQNPVNNLRVALRLRLSPLGWNHWSTYKDGKYMHFTEGAVSAVTTVLGAAG